MTNWSATPIIDWVLHKGRHLTDPCELVGGMCDRVASAGMPLERVAVFVRTLHEEPVAPRRLRPSISVDLEVITLKMLSPYEKGWSVAPMIEVPA